MGGLIIVIAIKIITKVISAQRRPAYTGAEEIVGGTAVVRETLDPRGTVIFRGENWTAISESGTIEPDEEVVITKYDSLKLWVTRKT